MDEGTVEVSQTLPDADEPGFAFDRFVLLPRRQSLLKDGVPIRVGGRVLDILAALVERHGEIISKSELMASVWVGVTVEESNLKVNMAALRKALGDDAGAARFIATVTGRGYRFIAPVARIRPAEVATLQSAPVKLNHNLPITTGRIFGRSDTIRAIADDLGDSPLVSVVGPGGIGKTTVALSVAESMTGDFPDGVWLVDLSPLSDQTLVAGAIAAAIGTTTDSPRILATLCEHLRDRRMLIVLDSCEHVVGYAAQCASAILSHAPQVRVLATTREPLRVAGERVRRLTGLECPAAAELDAVGTIGFAAVQLFVDRAADHLDTFNFGDAEAAVVAEICRRLDGHALAIELAAARVSSFGVRGILGQLDDRSSLGLAQRGGPPRQHTLAATIQWSYDLLPEVERTIMVRLSTLSGWFGLDAAGHIGTDDQIDRRQVLAGLASLVDKSLVTAELRDMDVEYRLWDTTRAFALEKLARSADHDTVRHRHAVHFLQIANAAITRDGRLQHAEWISRYACHIDDLRSAASWALPHPAHGALGIELIIASIPFWRRLSLAEECRIAVGHALAPGLKTARTPQQELILLQTLGATLLDIQGTVPEVKSALKAALEIASALGDKDRQLECLRGLSTFEVLTGDSTAALELAERIRAIEPRQGLGGDSRADDAAAGPALEWLGQLTAARDHLEKSIRHEHPRSASARFDFNQHLMSLASMTMVLWLQGLADQARATSRRMLEEAKASHYAWSYCYAHFQAATLALHLREYDAAKLLTDDAEAHAIRHGLSFWRRVFVTGQRCRWNLYMGQRVDVEALRPALATFHDLGFRMFYPHLLTNFGEAAARFGDLGEGLAAIDQALALCEATGQVVAIPEILRIKGNVIAWQVPWDWELAADCYRTSIAMAQRDGSLSWEIRSATSLVKLTRHHGGDDDAEAALAACYGRFTEGFGTGDLTRAKALIESR